MKRKSQIQTILEFVQRHPGCSNNDVSTGTGLKKKNTSSTLNKLTFDCRVKRTGEPGEYRYTYLGREITKPEPKRVTNPSARFGCANPLTELFNQCLAGVRA